MEGRELERSAPVDGIGDCSSVRIRTSTTAGAGVAEAGRATVCAAITGMSRAPVAFEESREDATGTGDCAGEEMVAAGVAESGADVKFWSEASLAIFFEACAGAGECLKMPGRNPAASPKPRA